MPYVIRDKDGRVTGLSEECQGAASEQLNLSRPDVKKFLTAAKDQLSSSSVETIRVIEDLVDLLIQKKLILITDLPLDAQQKLSERQRMHSELNVLDNLMVYEEDIL